MSQKIVAVFILIVSALYLPHATGAMAVETLIDSIKNGQVSGEAKIWYQTNDNDADKHIFDSENSWFDAGLNLGYETGKYKGFAAGARFYGVDDLGAYENWADRSMMGVNRSDSESWLGEAYISYEYGKTKAKLGRQNLTSPLLNSDKWAIFPNNFEGFLVTNADIPGTMLISAYVWEERWLQSRDFEDFYDKVLMLGAVNQTLPNTTVTAYLYYLDEDTLNYATREPSWDTLSAYLETVIRLKPFDLGFQYIHMDPDQSSFEETDAIAAKISAKIAGFSVSAAYSYVTDGRLPAAKISDHRIKTPIYTATIAGDGDVAGRPDTESARISAEISPFESVSFMAAYAYYSMDRTTYYTDICDGDCSQAEFVCKYTGISHVTLWGALWYSDHEGIGVYNGLNNDELITFRVWASFKF